MARTKQALIALALSLLAPGCALIRGTPVTQPDPHQYPCGAQGVECHDTNPPTCCGPRQACASDDGGPYCAADEGWDGGDPVTWGYMPRHQRLQRQ